MLDHIEVGLVKLVQELLTKHILCWVLASLRKWHTTEIHLNIVSRYSLEVPLQIIHHALNVCENAV
jgi:hypothetical protein